jgi:LDH2 family malate/lactate/ureidoglycolate dehydrogenase
MLMAALVLSRECTLCAALSVKNSNHYGAASIYSLYAAKQGMIGLTFSNTDALIVPFNGIEACLAPTPNKGQVGALKGVGGYKGMGLTLMVQIIRDSTRADPDVSILIPGDVEQRQYRQRIEEGIPLSSAEYQLLFE